MFQADKNVVFPLPSPVAHTCVSTEDIWAVLLRNNSSTNNLPLRRGQSCYLCWNHSREDKHDGKWQNLLFVEEHFLQGSPGFLSAKTLLADPHPTVSSMAKSTLCSSGQGTENHLYAQQAVREVPAMYVLSVFAWWYVEKIAVGQRFCHNPTAAGLDWDIPVCHYYLLTRAIYNKGLLYCFGHICILRNF